MSVLLLAPRQSFCGTTYHLRRSVSHVNYVCREPYSCTYRPSSPGLIRDLTRSSFKQPSQSKRPLRPFQHTMTRGIHNTDTSLSQQSKDYPKTKTPPRILIFGTGAIGASYTYILSRQVPESNLVCICRSNYEAARKDGFTINSNLWGNNLKIKPTIARSVDEATSLSEEPFDYIIVTAKALSSKPTAAELIRPAIGPNTTIVLIQNGVGIEQSYSTLYPTNPLLSTVIYLPVTQSTPGVITHREIELLHVGTYPSSAPAAHKAAAQTFTELLTSCSANFKLHDDVQPERWSKLLVNASWNPIGALSRCRDAEFVKETQVPEEEAAAYVRDVMNEIASVARACGYSSIDEKMVEFQIGRALARSPPGIETSMLADAKSGKRLEVDAVIGNAVRIAREKGVKTPLLRGLYILLSGLDRSFAGEPVAKQE